MDGHKTYKFIGDGTFWLEAVWFRNCWTSFCSPAPLCKSFAPNDGDHHGGAPPSDVRRQVAATFTP